MKKTSLILTGIVALVMLSGAKGDGCTPGPVACTDSADCNADEYCGDDGYCAELGACVEAADCYGQPIIVPMCVGYFTCGEGSCNYHCGIAPGQGQKCGDGDVCAQGLTCVHYYGIAGPQGPEFRSCEIPCGTGTNGLCPSGQQCVTIADGPGEVCRPDTGTGCNPAELQSCGADLVCVANTINEQGNCEPFAHGVSVGAGYKCGGSIGVSCADGLVCDGLPVNGVGGTGTCVVK